MKMNCQSIHKTIIPLMCQSAKDKIMETKNKSMASRHWSGMEKSPDYKGGTT